MNEISDGLLFGFYVSVPVHTVHIYMWVVQVIAPVHMLYIRGLIKTF
jgi:hypothetical protein